MFNYVLKNSIKYVNTNFTVRTSIYRYILANIITKSVKFLLHSFVCDPDLGAIFRFDADLNQKNYISSALNKKSEIWRRSGSKKHLDTFWGSQKRLG